MQTILLLTSDSDLTSLGHKLQSSLDPVVEWACLKKLLIAPTKSQVTLFTPFTKQVAVAIDGVNIPFCQTPKILGVTFDTLFCFRNHVLEICAKASQRLNIMRAVSGTTWGHDRQTLLLTI
jgi:hypothetical protein